MALLDHCGFWCNIFSKYGQECICTQCYNFLGNKLFVTHLYSGIDKTYELKIFINIYSLAEAVVCLK